MRKNYWKELCLLLIGLFVGISTERYNLTSHPKLIELDIKKDTIVYRDTLYAYQTIVPLTAGNVLAELNKQNVPHSSIVLKQSKLETGNYTSKVCKTKNNLFGIRKGNNYKSYETWKDCIADYKRLFSKKYKGGDYYEYLRTVGYAEDPKYINKLKEMV